MAIVKPYRDVPAEAVSDSGAKATFIRWLISKKEGAPNFAMRLFEVEPGGYTPFHEHPWEHEVFVLEGKGKLVLEKEEIPFEKEYFIFVPPDEKHQFKNTGDSILRFLCIIPLKD
ncbi:MAG: cupin [Candidatus Hydrothermota bacterium]|nr:MAG: cupin [Candidatus Hydrothermae bacterium]